MLINILQFCLKEYYETLITMIKFPTTRHTTLNIKTHHVVKILRYRLLLSIYMCMLNFLRLLHRLRKLESCVSEHIC